jgi:hypothetical protein
MYLFKHSTAKAGPFYYLIECCNSEAQDDTGANMCLARLFYANHDNRLAARPCNCSRVALMLAVAGANLEKIIENHTVDCTSRMLATIKQNTVPGVQTAMTSPIMLSTRTIEATALA